MNGMLGTVAGILNRNRMAVAALLVAVAAYCFDGLFTTWIQSPDFLWGQISVPNLLMIIMFGMGMTMKPGDFLGILRQPIYVLAGEAVQFTVMPLTGIILCGIFQLPPELAAGVILVGCCPGGTASNVMTYLARGDVALSVSMTALSTLLAPFVTPFLVLLCLEIYQNSTSGAIQTDTAAMFYSILKIVVAPVFLGILLNTFCSGITRAAVKFLPAVSCTGICLIIGYVIDATSQQLATCGLLIMLVVILHNLLGMVAGWLTGTLLLTSFPRRSALALEVGMQNSGLAASLAAVCFAAAPLAAVPAAIFSAWHNISGALAASLMRRWTEKREQEQKQRTRSPQTAGSRS